MKKAYAAIMFVATLALLVSGAVASRGNGNNHIDFGAAYAEAEALAGAEGPLFAATETCTFTWADACGEDGCERAESGSFSRSFAF